MGMMGGSGSKGGGSKGDGSKGGSGGGSVSFIVIVASFSHTKAQLTCRGIVLIERRRKRYGHDGRQWIQGRLGI
jgi:hypothetical protein